MRRDSRRVDVVNRRWPERCQFVIEIRVSGLLPRPQGTFLSCSSEIGKSDPARAGGMLLAIARCDGYSLRIQLLGARRASHARAWHYRARALSVGGGA
jgi:hypothetical protein